MCNPPISLLICVLLFPLVLYLVPRGIYVLIKGISNRATVFVIISLIVSFLISGYFVITNSLISDLFLYLMFPFGVFGFFLTISGFGESSIAALLGFLFGSFFNACAFAALIEFADKLTKRRNPKLQ